MSKPAESTSTESRLSQFVRSGAGIAVAMVVMNVSTYGYQMWSARVLGPQGYGSVASMLQFLLVVTVVALGLQATAARRISADPAHVAQIEREIMRVTWRASLGMGVALLALAPVINWALKLDDLATAALVAPCATVMTFMGGQAGILQGERRWLALGLVYIAAGLPRFVLGAVLLAIKPTEFMAILAVMIGAIFPILIAAVALGRHDRAEGRTSASHGGRAIFKESLANSQALFAYFALTSIDLIVVASNVLSRHDRGLYASGLIVAKAVLFLPQFVVVVAFPAMSTAHERRQALTRSLSVVLGLGVLATAAVWLLAPLAMIFAGGAKYSEVQDKLWLFAILGTCMSMLQLLVYSVLARQGMKLILLVWTALIAVVAGGLMTDSINGLLSWVLIVDLTLLVVLTALSFWLMGKDLIEAPEAVDPTIQLGEA